MSNGNGRFTGQVKLHSILLRTSDSDSAPKTLKVIINREDVDFGVAEETDGTQTLELSRTAEVQELPVVSLFFRSRWEYREWGIKATMYFDADA